MTAVAARPAWWDQAACVDDQPSDELCAGCTARWHCLDHALVNQIRDGVWGGYSPAERRRLLFRARHDPAEALVAAYHAHSTDDAHAQYRATIGHPAVATQFALDFPPPDQLSLFDSPGDSAGITPRKDPS